MNNKLNKVIILLIWDLKKPKKIKSYKINKMFKIQ